MPTLFRSYSHFSLLSATSKIEALVKDAKLKGYTAIALTDEDTTSGLVEFYDECTSQQIKPILGTTLRISNLSDTKENFGRQNGYSKISLLAKNANGYRAILELTTIARTIKEEKSYHIDLTDLQKYLNKDLELDFFVVITGLDHEIGNYLISDNQSKGQIILNKYIKSLGAKNILVEAINPRKSDDLNQMKTINQNLLAFCHDNKLEFILSPAPRYLNTEDEESFKVVLAIKKQMKIYDIELERSFNLPDVGLLNEQFNYLNYNVDTAKISEQINFELRTDYANKASEAFFPPVELEEEQTYDGILTWNTYLGLISKFHTEQKTLAEWQVIYPYQCLKELIIECLEMPISPEKLISYPIEFWTETPNRIKDYIDQIEIELTIIKNKGYSSYFIVVADMAQYCKNNNITASARGSGAGSLIGFLNNISTADTVFYQIPFERFLNPLRPSAPDIDLDVADDKRADVINYLKEKYGVERVCQVVTYGTMLPRVAIRDIGRVLGIAYRKCDQLSKLIPSPPFGKKPSFEYAFSTSPELTQVYENDADVTRIIDIAKKLEGNYRHSSVHAAAVLVTPTKVSDYASVQWDSEHSMLVCQYDWHDCEKIGILPCKMDILGITNLSILSNSIKLVKKHENKVIDLFNIDFNDPKVYQLLSEGKTMGVFQLSSSGMTKYITQLKPTKVEDLIAMVALYRPGAMNSIPEFISRKNDPKKIKYYVPIMEEWMADTYGVLVYQEDIMFTFMKLAGYSFGQADNVRRAMGKKNKEVLDKEFVNFKSGALERGFEEEKINEIWDLIVPFTDYGFNKAHAAAYGIVAYWTAFMKANYPAEFMTALMTSEEGDMTKITNAINECNSLGIKVLPPSINTSYHSYTIESKQEIRYGLGSVKNLGSDIIKFIIEEREKNGVFIDLDDFLNRIANMQTFNKRSLEALIISGALDNITDIT